MRTILLTFGLIMLLALPSIGQQTLLGSAQGDVSLTILEYGYIEFQNSPASFDIIIDPADWSSPTATDCEQQGFTVGANFTATLLQDLTPPPNAPGVWNCVMTPEGSWGPGIEPNGTVDVCVQNIGVLDGTGNWSGGSLAIEIWGS